MSSSDEEMDPQDSIFDRLRRARETGDIVRDLSALADDDDDDEGCKENGDVRRRVLVEDDNAEASPAKRRKGADVRRDVLDIRLMVESSVAGPVSLDAFEKLSVCEDVTMSDGELDGAAAKSLLFYWLDVYEDEASGSNVLYLSGKAENGDSMVVRVDGVERRLVLVPQPEGRTLDDVEKEFTERFAPRLTSWRMQRLTAKNCFFAEMKACLVEVVEVWCVGPVPAAGASWVLGCRTSLTENFLLSQSLKGPCWLALDDARESCQSWSWCSRELVVRSADVKPALSPTPSAPALRVLSLSFGFVPNSQNHQVRELCAVDGVLTSMRLTEPSSEPWTVESADKAAAAFSVVSTTQSVKVPFDFRAMCLAQHHRHEILTAERALIGFLLNQIHRSDPDVILGHDIARSHLEALLGRITETKTPFWSKLGRLKRRSAVPRHLASGCGRLVVDVALSARELITRTLRSFDLPTLCQSLLKETRATAAALKPAFGASESLLAALNSLRLDSIAGLNLAAKMNVLPLAFQTTCICGNLLGRTLLGGRAERNEFLLLHAFNRAGFILPEPGRAVDGEAADKTFAGGLVLEPKTGFYDSFVLLLDFNSLYPSIIQEYNLCFTKAEQQQQRGVLPAEIEKLVQSRKEVRKLMANSTGDLHAHYMIRQTALKLTANSVYGCLGYARSRFYSRELAAQVTQLGRETLERTKTLVESLHVEVIYGDTDSIMINTCLNDLEQVRQLGIRLKTEINRQYQRLEIDVDGVFKCLLLMKKKKYAGLLVESVDERTGELITSRHVKGLDLVRRDWCPLAKDCGNAVLDLILSGLPLDDVVSRVCTVLSEVADRVRADSVPLEKFLIDKQITKRLALYADPKGLPHVQVALRMAQAGACLVKPGDVVSYVVCEDGSGAPATQRAYSLAELKAADAGKLTVDRTYYLASQVQPVVCRLVEPLQSLDTAVVAECLGLPTALAIRPTQVVDPDDQPDPTAARFDACAPFTIVCLECKRICEWVAPFRQPTPDAFVSVLERGCNGPDCKWAPINTLPYIKNAIVDQLNQHLHVHYLGWQRCEDISCHHRTRHVPIRTVNCKPVCPACLKSNLVPDTPADETYTQFLFFESIFDLDAFKRAQGKQLPALVKAEAGSRHALAELKEFVRTRFIDRSAFGYVDLADLFEGL